MKPVRQMLHVPSDPCGQRSILVILIHGSEVPPLGVPAHQLHYPAFEIDPKPLPLQQKQARSSRRMLRRETWAKPGRREKQADESRLQKHSVGLVSRKILRRTYERKKQ